MNRIKHLLYFVTPCAIAVSVASAVAYPNMFDNGLGYSLNACGMTASRYTREKVSGWPFAYDREKEQILHQAGSPPVASHVSSFDIRSLIGNIAIGVLMSCTTFAVIVSLLGKRFSLQFRLETLFLIIATTSVVFGIYQSREVLEILLGRPIVVSPLFEQSLLLTVPLMIGVSCLVFSTLWCGLRLIALVFKWFELRTTSLRLTKSE